MPIPMASRRQFTPTLALSLALAWGLSSGCGGGESGELSTVRVSGTLTINGKPASKGTIHFQPAKGRPSTGIVEDGKFTLSTYKDGDGAIPGKTQVAVEVVEEVPTKDGDTTSKSLIPGKFMDPSKSGLQLEVRPSGYSNLQINITNDAGSIKED